MSARTRAVGYAIALLALGCGKTRHNGAVDQAGAAGAAGMQNMAGMPGVEPEACASPQPGPSPMLRLDRFQLERTLRDLFSDAPAVVSELEPVFAALPVESSEAAASAPTQPEVDVYHELAHTAALALSSDAASLVAFVGCDPEQSDAASCRDQFVTRFLGLTSRRPATPDEVTEALTVFATGQELGGGEFASGVRAVVETVLQGPDFLYMVEQGGGDAEAGAVPLSGHETATRLAYLLTGSMPDAELVAAADAGAFTDAALEAQVRRLIGTAANRRVARHFMARLLGYESLAEIDVTLFPSYTPDIAALTHEESGRFVEDVMFDGAGTFRALMSERSTWLNRPLAEFYGISGVTSEAFQKVDLSSVPRAGILTQSAFLAATSQGGQPHPVVARGVSVLRNVLCVELSPGPTEVPPAPETPDGATFRQQLELYTSDPACHECHRDVNAVGFAFEDYDGVGSWRDLDNGQPIDTSGTLSVTDAQGDFGNAAELVERIAESQDAQSCFIRNWMSYAYGRPEAPDDACARQAVEAAFRDSDGNIVEMLVALAKTDQLRYRLASELAP